MEIARDIPRYGIHGVGPDVELEVQPRLEVHICCERCHVVISQKVFIKVFFKGLLRSLRRCFARVYLILQGCIQEVFIKVSCKGFRLGT